MPAPFELTVNARQAPLGLDTAAPEFGWKVPGTATQRAYELEVATDASFDAATRVWSSGLVEAERPFGIVYAGKPLTSRTQYHWRVRVHQDGDSSVTDWAAATFETAILDPAQWLAQWMTHPDSTAKDPRTLYFTTSVQLPAPVVRGRAYTSALGWYRLYVNGTNITGHTLVPRWTPFHQYTEYQTYDITDALRAGTNHLHMVVSEGRYRGKLGAFSVAARYGDRLAAFAQLELDLADGTSVQVLSDGRWCVGYGQVLHADPKDGERVDLRLPELPPPPADAGPGSSDPGVPGTSPVHLLGGHRALIAESVEPVTVIGRRPGLLSRTPSGKQLVDFGQNFSGVARVRLSGPAGAKVTLLYSEVLDPDGELATRYLEDDEKKKDQEWFQRDEVILGEGPIDYTPAYTIHGFRYLVIEGPADPLTAEDVQGIVLSSAAPQIAHFHASDPRLEQLWSNVLWSLRSNFTDTATDCPTRERSGWTGDIQVFGSTAAQMVDTRAFLRRYLRNLAVEQLTDGRVPPFIPSEASPGVSKPTLGFSSSSTGWGDVTVMLPWTLYRYYGDRTILTEQYDSARRWVDYLAHRATKRGLRRRLRRGVGHLERFIVDTGFQWGEWLRPGEDFRTEIVGGFTGKRAAVATAYLAHSARLLSDIAKVLGHSEDAARYRALSENATRAWQAAFVTAGGARIGDDKQDDYVRGLAFDLLTPEQRRPAADRLVELVEQAGVHLGTGFLSTPMLLDALVDSGHDDVAYRLLLQTSAPSWLGQVERGATTVWETWEGYKPTGEPTASHNHYAFGTVAAFLQERVAGLAPAAPGYARFRVAPIIGGGLTSASVTIDTLYGPAGSAWELEPSGSVRLSITVPPGTTAEVKLGNVHQEFPAGEHTVTADLSISQPTA
ncbi:family 78 glycoside hydrolase catalytic domain [Actinoplanes missouriensis]|uniref:alpha-L-rhamnosidase n=1 Tax=Actinoplanes missouriensis TaxID=1866 RepID=UPI0033BFE06B